MAAATARPLLPSILKVHKRDRESCNDGTFTIDSILAESTLEKVLPPLLACTAVDCEGFQQQQKGQESFSNDGTVHKKPRLDTTHMITTQTEVNQGILNSLHTMDKKIHFMDKKIQSMDKIMHGMQKAFKSHENIMKAIIDSMSLLQSSSEYALSPRYTTPRHSGSSSIQKQDKDTALASDPVPQTAPPPANESGSTLEVLAGVAVDQLKGTRVRWAEPLHDTSKHDSAPTEASKDVAIEPSEPSDQPRANLNDHAGPEECPKVQDSDTLGDDWLAGTIIDYTMMRAASVNADGRGMLRRVVVRLDHDMSTFTIYDSVSEALKQTNTGSASFYNNLNKTWFHLEECLSHLCKTTSAHKHEIANQIVKQSIKQFKIHWHKHSHAQDTWEPLDNVHLKTIISFFRDSPCMQTIICLLYTSPSPRD